MSSHKIDAVVQKYLQIRQKKAEMDKEHKQRIKRLTDAMSKLEAMLLEQFDEMGVESVRTKNGTPYTQLRESVNVGSRDDFLNFVRENDAWDMLESRVSKAAAIEYKNEHGELPPGLNYRAERVINVKSK